MRTDPRKDTRKGSVKFRVTDEEHRRHPDEAPRRNRPYSHNGFYEWTLGSDWKKQPIHFHLRGHELFAFAGLWTARTDEPSGEIIESCTIITTRPNELVAPVHDRMPVILPAEAESVWLDACVSKEHALSLLEPYPAELMAALPASTRVNSVRNDDSRLLHAEDTRAA